MNKTHPIKSPNETINTKLLDIHMLLLYGLVVLFHPIKSNQDPNKINQKTDIPQTQKHNMTLENLHLQ